MQVQTSLCIKHLLYSKDFSKRPQNVLLKTKFPGEIVNSIESGICSWRNTLLNIERVII